MKGAIALLLFAAAPAAAQTDPDVLYGEGVEAYRAGQPERAIRLLEQLVAAEPRNSEAWLQLGYARLAAGQLDTAEAAFRQVLSLAPDYADAYIGLARIAEQRGDRSGALAALEPVDPANSDASALRARLMAPPNDLEASPYRWRIDLDGSYSAVDGQSDWKEGSARLSYHATTETTLSGGLEASRRFGLSDTYGEFRIDHRFSPGASGYVFFGGTPNADFRAEWQIGLGGGLRVRSGPAATVLTIDARQSRYRSGDIQTISPGIEQYLAGGTVWLTGRWINVFDENDDHRSGWLARGDVLATPALRLFAGLADAPDVTEGVVVDTFSFFGGVSWDVDERTTLRLTAAHEDRKTGADRLQIGIGVGWRF